jgi:hypothetical protein
MKIWKERLQTDPLENNLFMSWDRPITRDHSVDTKRVQMCLLHLHLVIIRPFLINFIPPFIKKRSNLEITLTDIS